MKFRNARSRGASVLSADALCLIILAVGAFCVGGYHPSAEDGAIYVPAIKKILNPALYPFGAEFFETQTHFTLFPKLVAEFVRITHLPLADTLLVWHLASIFLLLCACWKVSAICFDGRLERLAGAALVSALLTIPVAGTALYIFDEYLNPRSIALFAAIFAIAAALRKRYVGAALWTAFGAVIHPLMSLFGLSLIAVIVWLRDCRAWPLGRGGAGSRAVALAATLLLPLGISFRSPSPAYREIIQMRPFFFLLRWQWYEWLGIFGPLLLLWWSSRLAKRNGRDTVDLLCRALIVFEAVYFAIALATTIPPQLLALVRYQPMRSLQLVYVLMFLIWGGWMGRWVLRGRVWLWLALFVPLCSGMFYAQRQLFPAVPHIEWPGRVPENDWLQAFAWIRANTPTDAIFALNPNYMNLPGEDHEGFRALAERSMLADRVKDPAVVALFPSLPMAEHWEAQIKALTGWEDFGSPDFERLRQEWKVTWVVLDNPKTRAEDCRYANRSLRVCRLD